MRSSRSGATRGARGIGTASARRSATSPTRTPCTSTFERIGDVDVLVNNAGIAESAPPDARRRSSTWGRHFDVNVTGPFCAPARLSRGCAPAGAGAIVTVASTAGRVGAPYTSAYTASKHAAVGLMRAVAAELAGTRRARQRRMPDLRPHRADRPGGRADRRADGSQRRGGRARARRGKRRSAGCSSPTRSPTRSCSSRPTPRPRSTARRS